MDDWVICAIDDWMTVRRMIKYEATVSNVFIDL